MTLGRSVYGDCLVIFLSFSSSRSFDARRHTLTHTIPCLQMSSEDSSNRADSGNAFEGASLSSLTSSSKQTPVFSWTESLWQELASHHGDDAEGSLRLLAVKMMLS